MVLVTVPIAAPTVAEVIAQTTQAKTAGADLVELRLDRCGEMAATIAAIPHLALPCIATIRHASENGGWTGDESARRDLLDEADRQGAAYVDIELAHLPNNWRPQQAQLILSYHDFSGMGGDDALWDARIDRMRAAGPGIVAKIAVTAGDAADLARIERVYRVHGKNGPLVAIAMGEHGYASRLLAGVWGGHIAFARLPDQSGSAPGQPFIADLLGMYRLRAQRRSTPIYAVIGNPIAHSLSPLIHNAAFAHLGIDAVYVPIRVDDAPAFWRACGSWIAGLSITIPHKHAVQELMAVVEPEARVIGAMNTIWRRDGVVTGANTDAPAITDCLVTTLRRGGEGIDSLRGKRVLVLGAGGAGRAAAFACRARGATVAVTNRTFARAEELAADCGCLALTDEQAATWTYDCLVNGTAVGMRNPDGTIPDETPWPAGRHRRGSVVFDTVYTPLRTRLLREAEAAGAITIRGVDMFIAQAAGQFTRWTGRDAPVELMADLVLRRLS
jgi:3-dehydroquinate dehydratase/shikimate dehydrogenase